MEENVGGNDARRDIWGVTLVKIPRSLLNSWTFPETTLVFLESVGLPLKSGYIKNLNLQLTLDPANTQLLILNGVRHLIIGKAGSYTLCLADQTAEVFMLSILDDQQHRSRLFVNSSVLKFLEFLEAYLARKQEMSLLAHEIDNRMEDIPRD